MRRGNSNDSHGYASNLGHIAHGDSVDRPNVIEHCAPLFNMHHAITGAQLDERGPYAAEVGSFPANNSGKCPFSGWFLGQTLPSGQREIGLIHTNLLVANS